MIFDKKKGKGVHRKSLPEPNPVTIDFEKDGTLGNVGIQNYLTQRC